MSEQARRKPGLFRHGPEGQVRATDERLLPQVLKDAGYTTAIIGKWRLGHADNKY